MRQVLIFVVAQPNIAYLKEEAGPCLSWFLRVPSHSNLADAPSRAKWKDLEFLEPYTRDRPALFLNAGFRTSSLDVLIGRKASATSVAARLSVVRCVCVAYSCHSYFTSRASALAEKKSTVRVMYLFEYVNVSISIRKYI